MTGIVKAWSPSLLEAGEGVQVNKPMPPTEAHVQRAVVSAALMGAMCDGTFRCGAIIFEAPGHGEFRGYAILAPWPWIRSGSDTPWTMIERFKKMQAEADAQIFAPAGRVGKESK